MLSRSNGLILGLAVLAAVLGGYIEHRDRRPSPDFVPSSNLIGQTSPALSLTDLDGKLHRLSDYRGRRVLLNFWASWCRPCREEMPALNQIQAKSGKNAPIVIGIAIDEPARVRAFLAAHPVNYPILIGRMDAPDTSLQWGDASRVLPYSVLVDADERVLATHAGALSASQLEHWLAPPAGQP
jgi:thiol-disulfide isomerase/thioredoxin